LISLLPYTIERCHKVYRAYVPDTMMTNEIYEYDEERVNTYYRNKVMDTSRKYFAIALGESIVGEIQIKYINKEKGHGTLSIILINDEYKNKGYGSEAIRLILGYAKDVLKLNKVYADAVHRNLRSIYVLEKIGFIHIKDDNRLRYYEYSL